MKTSKLPTNIFRFKCNGYTGYKLSIFRRGVWYIKYFSDAYYGSSIASFKAAVTHKEEVFTAMREAADAVDGTSKKKRAAEAELLDVLRSRAS